MDSQSLFFNCENFLPNKLFRITTSLDEQIMIGEKMGLEGQKNKEQKGE